MKKTKVKRRLQAKMSQRRMIKRVLMTKHVYSLWKWLRHPLDSLPWISMPNWPCLLESKGWCLIGKVAQSSWSGTILAVFKSQGDFGLFVMMGNISQSVLKDTLVNGLTSIAASSAIQCLELLLYHSLLYYFTGLFFNQKKNCFHVITLRIRSLVNWLFIHFFLLFKRVVPSGVVFTMGSTALKASLANW